MNQPAGPAPADLSQWLLDRPQDGQFKVGKRLFTDPEIFELEMERIFEGNWIYLCHESQIPRPHDYITLPMGREPVVVIRAADGSVGAYINACAHRGAKLCRTQRGQSKFLVCPYHGWVYDSTGRNVEIKDRDSGGYPDHFGQQSHDLKRIARLESYAGFVFGSLSDEVPPLAEYLGQARPFVEMLDEMGEQGVEVIPGASTYIYEGNWKMQAENGIDGYHFTTIHANYVGVIGRRMKAATSGGEDKVKMGYDDSMMKGFKSGAYDLNNGHAVIWIDFPMPQNRPLWEQREALAQRIDPERAEWLLKRQRNLLIYPNVQLMDQASTQIRVFRPISATRTEVKIYCIAPRGESAGARERRIRQYEDFFNATGMATPDDLMVFELCQEGYEARSVEWQQGYDRGITRMVRGADENARKLGVEPYSSSPDATDETLFHGQYREWNRLLHEGMERDGLIPAQAPAARAKNG